MEGVARQGAPNTTEQTPDSDDAARLVEAYEAIERTYRGAVLSSSAATSYSSTNLTGRPNWSEAKSG